MTGFLSAYKVGTVRSSRPSIIKKVWFRAGGSGAKGSGGMCAHGCSGQRSGVQCPALKSHASL
eukprot:2772655-Pyramimonas_sp.AAC.2